MECRGSAVARIMAVMDRCRVSDGFDERAVPRRTLAGATILQIVPGLDEEPAARSAVNIAHVLLLAGARALVAAEGGPLVNELTDRRRRMDPDGQRQRQSVPAAAQCARARTAHRAANASTSSMPMTPARPGARASRRRRSRCWLVTTLPDVPSYAGMRGRYAGALAQGDRVIAPSNYSAVPIMERYGLRAEQITIVPRVIDTATYDPAAVSPRARRTRCAQRWRVARRRPRRHGARAASRPGTARSCCPRSRACSSTTASRGFVFVLVGESTTHAKYARDVLKRAQAMDVDDLFRMVGHCDDMPAAFAAADFVAVPAIEPPLLGRVVAQAQAMGRPVVTTDVGMLAGAHRGAAADAGGRANRLDGDARRSGRLRAGVGRALSLDDTAYRGMSARARQFAEYMFSPESVADAMRSVYTSLLARDL